MRQNTTLAHNAVPLHIHIFRAGDIIEISRAKMVFRSTTTAVGEEGGDWRPGGVGESAGGGDEGRSRAKGAGGEEARGH